MRICIFICLSFHSAKQKEKQKIEGKVAKLGLIKRNAVSLDGKLNSGIHCYKMQAKTLKILRWITAYVDDLKSDI